MQTFSCFAIWRLMKLVAITQQDLKSLSKLLKRQDSISTLLKLIDKRLDNIERSIGKRLTTGKTSSSSSKRPKIPLDKRIPEALKKAGKGGIRVPELAKKIKAHLPTVRVWFSKNAKSNKNVKRVSRGTYQWIGK